MDTCSNLRNTTDKDIVSECASVLERGGVVAVPTDTIYGIASSALDKTALDKIYAMKGRTKLKPLAVCVGNVQDIDK